jgi:hypothetical protein
MQAANGDGIWSGGCRKIALAAVLLTLIGLAPPLQAQELPRPPCDGPPVPAFASPGLPPTLRTWRPNDLPANWAPPACLGWPRPHRQLIVVLAGSFAFAGTRDDLAQRFATVSKRRGIRYWSVSDGKWETLITAATALTASDGQKRGDFTLAELTSGHDLFFQQQDNRATNDVVYRLRLRSRTADRLEIEEENVSAVRLYVFTIWNPGDLHSLYVLQRLTDGSWGFYLYGSIDGGVASSAGAHLASFINRSVAFYRYFAGIPTDQEPPAAR